MKKILLIIIACVFTVSLFSQTSTRIQPYTKNTKKTTGDNPNLLKYKQYLVHKGNKLTNKHNLNDRVVMQKLDSITVIGLDEFGVHWQNKNKETFTYDNHGNNISHIFSGWDTSDNQWYSDFKREYTYDDLGNVLQFIYYDWNYINNQWWAGLKEENTYDTTGNIILQSFYLWDTTAGQWEIRGKDELSYNNDGKIILSVEYFKDESSGEWKKDKKSVYSYDIFGNQTKINYHWDDLNSQWIETNKIEQIYDDNGNCIVETGYHWENSQWQKSEKYEFHFHVNNKLSSESGFLWENNNWVNYSQDEYTYDESWNLITFINYMLSDSKDELEYYWKEEYTYNNAYCYDELIIPWASLPFLNPVRIYFNHMLNSSAGYAYQYGNWVYSIHNTFSYSDIEIGVEYILDHPLVETTVFPNPMDKLVNIKFQLNEKRDVEISILNILGQSVVTVFDGEKEKGSHQLSWDSESLLPGIYFMKFHLDNETLTYKVIKR